MAMLRWAPYLRGRRDLNSLSIIKTSIFHQSSGNILIPRPLISGLSVVPLALWTKRLHNHVGRAQRARAADSGEDWRLGPGGPR